MNASHHRPAPSLVDALARHAPADAREAEFRQRMLEFARGTPDPFDRRIPDRHFTGSAFVVSPDLSHVLLMHHKRLDRWLQFGGHAKPGESSGLVIAMRETEEESGLRPAFEPDLFDVDIHRIPARAAEPAHDHYDLRYLARAPRDAAFRLQPSEVKEIRWFPLEDAPVRGEESFERVLGKLRARRA